MNILKNVLSSLDNKMAIRIGKESGTHVVGAVSLTDKHFLDCHKNAILQLPVAISELSSACKRNAWVTATVYPEYDPNSNAEYHVTSNNKIYLCLSNNNGASSTQSPNTISLQNIVMSDGYVWRYVGDVATIDQDKTTTYISVPANQNVSIKNGVLARLENVSYNGEAFSSATSHVVTTTGSLAQFAIELDDQDELEYVSVTNGGTAYGESDYVLVADNFTGSGATVELDITAGVLSVDSFTGGTGYSVGSIIVVGDGTGAELTPTLTGGVLSGVTVVSGGTGYTWAKAFVFSSVAAAAGTIVLEPNNGCGYDVAQQVRSNAILLRKTLDDVVYPNYVYNNMEYNQLSVVLSTGTTPLVGIKHPNQALNKVVDVKECLCIQNIASETHVTSEKTYINIVLKMET